MKVEDSRETPGLLFPVPDDDEDDDDNDDDYDTQAMGASITPLDIIRGPVHTYLTRRIIYPFARRLLPTDSVAANATLRKPIQTENTFLIIPSSKIQINDKKIIKKYNKKL